MQRSGFPDAYAEHETRGARVGVGADRALPATVTCALGDADDGVAPDAFLARAARDFGDLPGTAGADGTVSLEAAALPGGEQDPGRLGWSVAQWAVASPRRRASPRCRVADRAGPGTAAPGATGAAALPPASVRVTLRAT